MAFLDETGLTHLWEKVTEKVESPLFEQTYTGIRATANNNDNATFFFATVRPTGYNDTVWHVKVAVDAVMAGRTDGIYRGTVDYYGSYSANQSYACFNNHYSTSYRCLYYHGLRPVTKAGYDAGYGHALGVNLTSSYSPTSTTYTRTFRIQILEADNCEITMFDNMKLYAALDGTGATNYAALISRDAYNNGLRETGDDNSVDRNCIASYIATARGAMYGGQLILSDDGTSWFSICTKARAISANNTCTTRGFSRRRILYYSATTTIADGQQNGASTLWTVIPFDLRYSSNKTSFTAHKPTYLKCTYDSATDLYTLNPTEWVTQTTPTEDDGFYYILLGYTYTTSSIYFNNICPVFKYVNGAFREVRPEMEYLIEGVANGSY